MPEVRQSPTKTLRQLEAAVKDARAFYGIDPLYETPVLADLSGRTAQIKMIPGYFYRPISVDLDYYQRHPHTIREDMAHEVAHLVTDELACLIQRLPPELRDEGEPLAMLLIDAIERATVRMERLYIRHA